jgi:NAD(P)H-quinone oxidoreductase subunit U, chloroplastic
LKQVKAAYEKMCEELNSKELEEEELNKEHELLKVLSINQES